ncbi:chromodomain Y-like protein 2 [Antedon mediterranea]|uniref:chromodomain Y-like protein 2 n=1 Tax=Antedon mediterranea TaxID=105859 RepID=UPI003AF96F40
MAEVGEKTHDDCVYEVEKVVNRRKTRHGKIQYLIRWKGFPSDDDTWEPLKNLANCRSHIDEFNENCDSKNTNKINGNGNMTAIKMSMGQNNLNKIDDINIRTTKRKQTMDADAYLMNGPEQTCNNSTASLFNESERLEDFPLSGNPLSDVNDFTNEKAVFNRSFSLSVNTEYSNPKTDFETPVKRHRCLSLRSSDEKIYRDNNHLLAGTTTSPDLFPKTPIVKLHDLSSSSAAGQGVDSWPNLRKLLTLTHKQKDKDNTNKDEQVMENASIQRALRSKQKCKDNSEKDRRLSLRHIECLFKFKEIVVRKYNGYTQVWFFTGSTVRNSLNPKVFHELTTILTNSVKDSNSVFLLHGAGNIFCSGVDLGFLAHRCNESRKKAARQMSEAIRKFIDTLINFPKIIVAAVNGSATGLGSAILPLCDIVYASDKAVFSTPYGSLAQVPEGCSSVTFPACMGTAMANEMLIGGRKLTALEAYACGLVSHVFWPSSFMQEVIPRVQNIVENSSKAMQMSKALIRSNNRAKMENANECECSMLEKCWTSLEGYKAIAKYIEKNKDIYI